MQNGGLEGNNHDARARDFEMLITRSRDLSLGWEHTRDSRLVLAPLSLKCHRGLPYSLQLKPC